MKKCIACGLRIKSIGERSDIEIFQCIYCGLGMTGKGGREENYDDYHRDSVYIKEHDQFSNIFQKRVEIISKFARPGKVLEVGSSAGLLLSLLKEKGWKVQGLDPSETAVEEARKRGIPTIKNSFEKAKITPNSFDLIVFNHVLEHMEEPIKVLGKVNKVLKLGGFVLIDVPNFGSFSAKLQGVNWGYAAPTEHLWHFTKDSLFFLLKRSSFIPIYWEARSGIWDYGNPTKEILQSLISIRKRFFKNILTALPTLLITKLKMGTSLTVVAKKPR